MQIGGWQFEEGVKIDRILGFGKKIKFLVFFWFDFQDMGDLWWVVRDRKIDGSELFVGLFSIFLKFGDVRIERILGFLERIDFWKSY